VKPREVEVPFDLDVDWSTREITVPVDRPALTVATSFEKVPPIWRALRYGLGSAFLPMSHRELNRLWRKIQAPLRDSMEECFESDYMVGDTGPTIVVVHR
jgi:hypothetical protein